MNTSFSILSCLDSFESLVWNERFNSPGDFELVVDASLDTLNDLQIDNYLEILDSDKTMIIESFGADTDNESGNYIKFKGRTLESILDRRIVWNQTSFSGNVQNGIKRLITENIINPSDSTRRIPNFIFEDSTDSAITSLRIEETQFTGDNLLEVVEAICAVCSIGFKIIRRGIQFVFKLIAGKDRSTAQTVLPQVVFSPKNDNLYSAKRSVNKQNYKNVVLVAGEGEGAARKKASYGSVSGLDRRELFVDARDISSNEGMEDEIPASQYTQMLIERGKSKLTDYIIEQEIESEADTTAGAMFEFQRDYFMGDIVEIESVLGERSLSRVVEMTRVYSGSETSTYPIFEQIQIA